jgi:hypothetical protein
MSRRSKSDGSVSFYSKCLAILTLSIVLNHCFNCRWRQPFLSNDPHQWTDGSGTIRRDIQTIAINGDKWEWEGEWAVDMEVIKGDEIDCDGWEYGTNFTSFSISNKRRNHSSLDCVRRRRWLRTRVPVAGSIDERFRPLTVFWDVQTLQSGTKRVEVRSCLQMRNAMPFAVIISLWGSGWTKEEEHGPFAENETFNVPLRQASASCIRIRLADFPYEWSQQVACGIQSHDYHSIRDVQCEGVGGEEMGYSPVCLRLLCTQVNKSVMVTISPVVLIINKLPCDLRYICNTSSRMTDEGCLLPGTTCKLANVNSSSNPEISFTMGSLMWSAPVPIDSQKVDPVKLDILSSDGLLGMILMISTCVASTGTVEVSVYSKGVVFDRTGGTGISLGARRMQNPKCEMARHTFKSTQSLVCSSPFMTHSQKQKCATLLKAEEKLHSKAHKALLISPLDDSMFPSYTANPSNSEAPEGLGAAESLIKGDGVPSSGAAATLTLVPIGKDTIPETTGQLSIQNLSAQSSRKYDAIRTDVGDLVYTDRALRWTYLPPQLRQQLSVRTPCDDEMVRAKQLVRFSVSGPSLVLLLMDLRSSKPPSWVNADGYSKMSDQAIARLAVKGVVYETYYGMFGKYLSEGEVVLGGNWSSEMHCMYSVFVIPVPESMSNSYFDKLYVPSSGDLTGKDTVATPPVDRAIRSDLQRLFDEATYDSSYKRSDVNNCWVDGGNGVALFHTDDDHVTVGVQVSPVSVSVLASRSISSIGD